MTKNNLKIVKLGKNREVEVKEKNKALEAAISQIDENFGKGSVMKLGQKAASKRKSNRNLRSGVIWKNYFGFTSSCGISKNWWHLWIY